MKVLLINAAEIASSPYVYSYIEIIDPIQDVEYTIIEWRRDHFCATKQCRNIISYSKPSPISSNKIKKFIDYYRFSVFIKNYLRDNKVDRIICFDVQISFFLRHILKRHYSQRYIIDIRDYNKLYPFIKNQVNELSNNAFCRVLSSPGYKLWLSPSYKDVICHNTTIKALNSLFDDCNVFGDDITILSIGSLRNFNISSMLINSMRPHKEVKFLFAGTGVDEQKLKDFSEGNSNVTFLGRYNKQDEINIAKKTDFINIILPNNLAHNSAISNRFYLSILTGKPMIVNKESIQAEYVLKYHLGVTVTSPDCYEEISDYIKHYSPIDYFNGRKEIIQILKKDVILFQNTLLGFLNIKRNE